MVVREQYSWIWWLSIYLNKMVVVVANTLTWMVVRWLLGSRMYNSRTVAGYGSYNRYLINGLQWLPIHSSGWLLDGC